MEDKLLDNSTRFKLRFWGIRIPLSIKPLKLGTLIYIAKYASQIGEVKNLSDAVAAIGTSKTNAKPLTRIAAVSILNSGTRIKLFARLLSMLLLWKLTAKELNSLLAIVINQAEIADFFLATTLATRINPAAGVVTSKEEKPSGDKSQD